ncbi:hypothetical protein CLV84_2227 [Neolewinella xylanilytica]|uniref:Secreted protein n=1 Tax=Neolewinella xylanilytica TaxID=1514080 RepID=A0A2S6I2C3_9BACT|nr:hypothetical protein [Neolewinella xylanilytica]PPK85332.1 hypothetical protein CLV84_2227 [Neolewinella xylanilytica]
MRFTAFSLALYLSLLVLFPCQDLASTVCTGSDAVGQQDGQDCPDQQDNCTALCFCSCCGVMAEAPPTPHALVIVLPLPPQGQTRPAYAPDWKVIDPAGGDLQPPRA